MSQIVAQKEIRFIQKRQKDEYGRVFEWDNRIFRGIFPIYESHIQSLFDSGFVKELVEKKLMPKTSISDIKIDGFSMIIEHERIWPVSFPQEWSFYMLREAALHVYEVGKIGKKFGFNMKDCHGLNVLFNGVSPMFIDLGSFIPDTIAGWLPYEEFLRFYYYPLNIWEKNSYVGKLSIFSANLTTHETYFLYQYPFLRNMEIEKRRSAIEKIVLEQINFERYNDQKNTAPTLKRKIKHAIKNIISDKKIQIPERLDAVTVLDKIRKFTPDELKTDWGNYHEVNTQKSKRFDRIIEIVHSLNDRLSTAVDIAGNQGMFSRMLIEQAGFDRVVCIDADEKAINEGFAKEKNASCGKLSFAHFDFMGTIAKLSYSLPKERFRSDAAFVLALLHHLILSQKYDIDDILENIKDYTNKYVFIEFMPLGLWSTGQTVQVPEWYTVDWFRDAFTKHFQLVHEEKLRDNYIIFVGKKSMN